MPPAQRMPQHIAAFRDAHHHVGAWPISGAAVVVESGNPGTDVRHVRGNGVARIFASRRRIDSLANSTQATVPERSGYQNRSRMGVLGLAASAVAACTAGWRDRRQSLLERSSVAGRRHAVDSVADVLRQTGDIGKPGDRPAQPRPEGARCYLNTCTPR